MTIGTNHRTQLLTGELADVRIVDCDVHPTPKAGEFLDYVDDKYVRLFANRYKGGGAATYYDPPDFHHAQAMRVDAFPADGNFAGSDPDMVFDQLVMGAGSDLVLLGPITTSIAHTDEELAGAWAATNRWLADCWLDDKHNWHGRTFGSIGVAMQTPELAAREIELWAEHPFMAQIYIQAEMRPSWGDPKYDPVWAAAVKHGIPVSCHLGRSDYNELPMSPVGFMTYNHDFMVTYSMLAANQVMSLIFDGVFDRFPDLKIVFIEHAFTWILPLMWRMDAMYEARGPENGLKRKPSDYVRDNIWFTTQPLDHPEDKTELTRALEWMEADKILLFSSDYPHWTFDDPQWVAKHIPEQMRDQVMFQNALDLFPKLPARVPALHGKKVAY
jgi:predicted TIM-barrel fold metal-dependent hydrolase